ncbi:MAG TPA: DUF3310 domain-containing protein [Gemmatimonadales bacterium]|nr:DUF3310 domain-containing protein [Gemmatimonadales bacterium]
MSDAVNHPAHYTTGRFRHALCGKPIEVIDVTQELGFCDGNTVKYVLRAGHKGDRLEDLRKARKYLDFEIARLERELAAAETEAILADPETMDAIREGEAALPSERAEAPIAVTVKYVPASDDDPWGARQITEIVNPAHDLGTIKALVVAQFGFGNPGAFGLYFPGHAFSLSRMSKFRDLVQEDPWTGILELRPTPEPVANGRRTRL